MDADIINILAQYNLKLSESVGDGMTVADRGFIRTSDEPVIFCYMTEINRGMCSYGIISAKSTFPNTPTASWDGVAQYFTKTTPKGRTVYFYGGSSMVSWRGMTANINSKSYTLADNWTFYTNGTLVNNDILKVCDELLF